MTRKYQDGDPGFSIIRPGNNVPSDYGPATGRDFNWVRGSWLERIRGRSIAESIKELKSGLELSTEYKHAAKAYEESRQALALAREQAAFLPLKLEQERQRLSAQLLVLQGELEAIVRRRELAQADHEIEMLEREEQRLAVKLRLKKLKLKRKELKGSRRQGHTAPAEPPKPEDPPEAFRRYWSTEHDVRRVRSAADERVEAIYRRAAAERRQLSDDELEEIDALTNAASGAESEIRRRAAGDF